MRKKNSAKKFGKPVKVKPYQYTRSTDRYSTIIMPSFRMSFGTVNVYVRPVAGHKEGMVVLCRDNTKEKG